jgi:hypothetical protein
MGRGIFVGAVAAALCALLVFGTAACLLHSAGDSKLRLSEAEYLDRVEAIWNAQLIAVLLGWAFEHKPASVEWVDQYPRQYQAGPVDDDWYYEIAALRAFEKYGVGMSVEQLGRQWLENNVGTWGSSEQARLALAKGLKAPDTGHPRHNRLWFTMGHQCRGDLFGMIAPAMPNLAARISREYGHVNSFSQGTDGGVLLSALISQAFIESDPKTLVRKASAVLHPETPMRQAVDEIIRLADSGKSFEEIATIVGERWHAVYAATNNAVGNGAMAVAALYFGEGDFLKTVNLAFAAHDFTDADCNAAFAGAVVAAMHGMKCLPPHLVAPLNDRIVGDRLGPVVLTPPVDEKISDLARRTVAVGRKLMAENGVMDEEGTLVIPVEPLSTQPAELFSPAHLVQFWNPEWRLIRAAYGAPGGGVRGIRGGTFIDADVLATYPQDESRGVLLRRDSSSFHGGVLRAEVGVDPGRAWKLDILANNERVYSRVMDGGTAFEWREMPPLSYPESYHVATREARRWEEIEIDLGAYAGKPLAIRMYQTILVPDRVPGNAYWRNLRVEF